MKKENIEGNAGLGVVLHRNATACFFTPIVASMQVLRCYSITEVMKNCKEE